MTSPGLLILAFGFVLIALASTPAVSRRIRVLLYTARSPGKLHYAWIIIAIAIFMHMAGGSVRQAFGVLIVPLQEDFGWSPAAVTFSYAMASIIGALVSPIMPAIAHANRECSPYVGVPGSWQRAGSADYAQIRLWGFS